MAFRNFALVAILIVAIIAPHFTAQPPTADDIISKDRYQRQSAIKAGYSIATKPKWGFFGTVFNLIKEQVNDTKSAYSQISDLVNNQFSDGNTATTETIAVNGTTPTPKISRADFLNILDRNLKGLARLRALEWREAKKDSAANLREYKDEIFTGKRLKNSR
ncbi:uncharacterized protein LOC114249448 [Bombyx mandarina]|uniref:Uncharacterized protein n=2 Tax=Bombyx TaxID=7090 RepID=A0A8R2AVR8_BOMMO|nr:uncharacterized protein LOC101736330 [Bombyx mori]XP_028038840.1 uncharacterized protein LOC114249448 [Bombyx mandarina]